MIAWAKSENLIFKITRAKRNEGVAQVAECLPSKFEGLSSTPVPQNKRSKLFISISASLHAAGPILCTIS
jgi:hypothetical protein